MEMAAATGALLSSSDKGGLPSNPQQQTAAAPEQQQIRLDALGIDQLQRLRKQIEEEMTLLRTNISALTTALDRFTMSLESVKSVKDGDSELMIPLSSSMYARGKTRTNGKVMIDLGTGFYAKVSNEEGQAMLNRKIEYVAKNRKAFNEELKRKTLMADQVMSVLQHKIQQQTTQ